MLHGFDDSGPSPRDSDAHVNESLTQTIRTTAAATQCVGPFEGTETSGSEFQAV